jgi:hypothetical protein
MLAASGDFMIFSSATVVAVALVSLLSSSAGAQRRASEHATVSQKVDGTTITMEYDRPVARGRELFGSLVRWGQTWTPGANNATTIDVDKDVRINGQTLPKGKYSVWMIPKESGPWTVIIHKNAKLFHTQRPTSQADEQLRFDATPEQGAHMETLAWYFPVVGPDLTTLRMHWGTTIVPMTIDVSPTATFDSLTASQRARYLGTYRMSGEWGAGGEITVTDVDGQLLATRLNPPPGGHPTFALIPAGGDHRFYAGMGDKGKVLEVTTSETIVFLLDGNRATAFEFRTPDGKTVWRGDIIKP